MLNTSHQQDAAVDFVADRYGRCRVEPSRFYYLTGLVYITGITDGVEKNRWGVRRDGALANVAEHDAPVRDYLRTVPEQRRPIIRPLRYPTYR